jgi:hypothetical protein
MRHKLKEVIVYIVKGNYSDKAEEIQKQTSSAQFHMPINIPVKFDDSMASTVLTTRDNS